MRKLFIVSLAVVMVVGFVSHAHAAPLMNKCKDLTQGDTNTFTVQAKQMKISDVVASTIGDSINIAPDTTTVTDTNYILEDGEDWSQDILINDRTYNFTVKAGGATTVCMYARDRS